MFFKNSISYFKKFIKKWHKIFIKNNFDKNYNTLYIFKTLKKPIF